MTSNSNSTTVKTGDTTVTVIQSDTVATIVVNEPNQDTTVVHIRPASNSGDK